MRPSISRSTVAGLFSVDHSAEAVNSRIGRDADPRLADIMSILVRHLHAAVKEARLTTKEWQTAIQFLTETGQMCTAWRQEFILLSDVLGVSMLVDALDHQRPEGATENTVLGPFHVADAPRYSNGATISLDKKGEPSLIRGRVLDTGGNPIAGACLDVWQCNDDGFYDVQQQDIQPQGNLRGIFESDSEGRFWFRSIKPRHYPIPHDGPVGKLLNLLGRHPYRAAHLHFIISANGYDTAVTHIFVPDCPYLAEDAVFGVKESLVVPFSKVDDAAQAAALGFDGPFWLAEKDFVLAGIGQQPTADIKTICK